MRTSLSAAALAVLLAQPLTAQGITGHVLDHESDRAIRGATVSLVDVHERVVRGVVTDSAGAFRLPVPATGRYHLRAERLGYASVTSSPLDLTADDSVTVELRMGAEAIPLAPLTVVGSSRRTIRNRTMDEFYQRQRAGWGTYFGPGDIERLRPATVTHLLQMARGVHVQHRGLRSHVQMRNARGACTPTVYVDRTRVPGDVELDTWVTGSSLYAVEVYPRGLGAPGEFMSVENYACGVIVLWTRQAVGG